MTTREHVIERLRANQSEELELKLNERHRFVLVFLLDDGTQTARIVRSAGSYAVALDMVADPPSLFVSEYLIDTDADLDRCVHIVYDDGEVERTPVAFSEQNLTFA